MTAKKLIQELAEQVANLELPVKVFVDGDPGFFADVTKVSVELDYVEIHYT